MSRKFEAIVESALQRYQGADFLVGDRVKFVDNYNSHDWFQGLPDLALERLKAIIESGDNIRVTSVTANRPTGTLPVNAPNVVGTSIGIAREQAPGLFTSPFTVPHDIIVLQEDGINLAGETPEGQIRKDTSHIKPAEVDSDSDNLAVKKQTGVDEGDRKLTDKNEKLPNAEEPTPGESYTKKYMEN